MFQVTRDWLFKYYGSTQPGQIDQTRGWLLKYGKDVPVGVLFEWSQWKHLSEYQVNTPDIVPRALAMIGREYNSELEVHAALNKLRVPNAADAYRLALSIARPKTILELGVGGDSAISTAQFLYYCEQNNATLISVDINPLGMTLERYRQYPFWSFIQANSAIVLQKYLSESLWFDLIFIDTIHAYSHTLKELETASKLTDFMLMDDMSFPGNSFDDAPGGVKRAISEWLDRNTAWTKQDMAGADVCLLMKRT